MSYYGGGERRDKGKKGRWENRRAKPKKKMNE
jgi:hypothetical protein